MLVLSRKLDESFIINGNIEVVVTAIQGNKVSLGIAAPADVTIFRKELFLPPEERKRQKIASDTKSGKMKSNWNILGGVKTLR